MTILICELTGYYTNTFRISGFPVQAQVSEDNDGNTSFPNAEYFNNETVLRFDHLQLEGHKVELKITQTKLYSVLRENYLECKGDLYIDNRLIPLERAFSVFPEVHHDPDNGELYMEMRIGMNRNFIDAIIVMLDPENKTNEFNYDSDADLENTSSELSGDDESSSIENLSPAYSCSPDDYSLSEDAHSNKRRAIKAPSFHEARTNSDDVSVRSLIEEGLFLFNPVPLEDEVVIDRTAKRNKLDDLELPRLSEEDLPELFDGVLTAVEEEIARSYEGAQTKVDGAATCLFDGNDEAVAASMLLKL